MFIFITNDKTEQVNVCNNGVVIRTYVVDKV